MGQRVMLMWWSCPFYRGHLGGGNIVTPDKFEVLGNWEEAHTLQQSFFKVIFQKGEQNKPQPSGKYILCILFHNA